MNELWKKLNLKDQQQILVVNAPKSFGPILKQVGDIKVTQRFGKSKKIAFVLAFVTTRTEIEQVTARIADLTERDAVVWFAYPKQTSKRYECDFNRDSGWEPLGKVGFQGVRQVAIDEDWSALRFRRAEFIKSKTRGARKAK